MRPKSAFLELYIQYLNRILWFSTILESRMKRVSTCPPGQNTLQNNSDLVQWDWSISSLYFRFFGRDLSISQVQNWNRSQMKGLVILHSIGVSICKYFLYLWKKVFLKFQKTKHIIWLSISIGNWQWKGRPRISFQL